MKKIQISFARDLKKTEFKILFEQVSSILENKNVAHPTIQELTSMIKQRNEELLNLRIGLLRHDLTAVINEKLKTRTRYLTSFRKYIEAGMTTCIPAHREAGRRLSLWLERYKKELYKPTITVQSNLIRAMMDDRENTPEIKEAITLLNLDVLCDAIIELTHEIDNDLLQRSQETTLYSMKVNGLRDGAYKELRLLANTLPTVYGMPSTTAEQKEDIAALSRSLNYLITGIRGIFRSRITKNRNKEIEAAIKELIEAEETDNRIEKKQVAPANGSNQIAQEAPWVAWSSRSMQPRELHTQGSPTPSSANREFQLVRSLLL